MIGPLALHGEKATAQLAQDIAMVAGPGWVIRLEGDLGAGKTTFARAFIRALAGDDGFEVPSPTYTLVQRYDEVSPQVLHADLYRLSDPDEMVELGLDDPTDPAVRLIEWPGNAGEGAFAGALTLSFAMAPGETVADARALSITGPKDMLDRLARTFSIRLFLDDAGYQGATRQRLMGDASTRRYERLSASSNDQPLVLMDAARQPDGPQVRPHISAANQTARPYSQLVHLAESVHAFAAVGTALAQRGFAAPVLHAADLEAGLLLIEDLGSNSILDEQGVPVAERAIASAQLLADLHACDWPANLPIPGADGSAKHHLQRYDSDVFLTEIGLCPDWYVAHRGVRADDFDRLGFEAAWAAILAPLDTEPATLTLRDYHSPNIIWRDDQSGNARLGLIDHQDALLGPPAYDLASLVYDARVTIPPALQAQMVDAYVQASGADPAHVKARVATMAGQRCTKILGIFARLNARDGKPGYLKHLPRVEAYMHAALAHPVLEPLRPYYDQLLPRDGA